MDVVRCPSRWIILCTFSLSSLCAGQGQIRGRVVDPTSPVLGNAFVRLVPHDRTSARYGVLTSRDGTFEIAGVQDGVYDLSAWLQGFRKQYIRRVSVRDGDTANVGDIQLNIGSCDAPGVMCDDFGAFGAVPHRSARGSVVLIPLCRVDLDTGEVFCPQKPDRVDLSLSESNTGKLYVNPAQRALIRPDCNRASDDNNPLRVDELGPGDDFCVRTKQGRIAHIFVTDEVSPDDVKLRLWFVTR